MFCHGDTRNEQNNKSISINLEGMRVVPRNKIKGTCCKNDGAFHEFFPKRIHWLA